MHSQEEQQEQKKKEYKKRSYEPNLDRDEKTQSIFCIPIATVIRGRLSKQQQNLVSPFPDRTLQHFRA